MLCLVFFVFLRQQLFLFLLQNQTAPTLSFSLREKTPCCSRRQRARVSHTPLLALLACCSTLSSHSLPFLLLHLSLLMSLGPFIFLFICFLHSSLFPSSPSPAVSITSSLFQAAHCLLCECLKSIPPTLRSSVSELPSNLSFHWQLHNVLRSHGAIHRVHKDRRTLKSHYSLVPHHCHAAGLIALI